MQNAPQVVGIGGSTGATSTTTRLLRDCLDRLATLGAETVLFGPDMLAALPLFAVHSDARSAESERLAEAVRRADAVVIATPGYHGGISGLVKNAIDHLELLREDERPYLDGRAVGAIVTAAGWQASGTTLVAVRSAIHALRGWPTPFAVTVNTVEQQLDDPRVEGAIEVLAGQVMRFCEWQAAARLTR
jgi:FMN reductase